MQARFPPEKLTRNLIIGRRYDDPTNATRKIIAFIRTYRSEFDLSFPSQLQACTQRPFGGFGRSRLQRVGRTGSGALPDSQHVLLPVSSILT